MKKVLLFFILFFIFSFSKAATFTSIASGDWNSDATWSGTGIPGVNDVVIINSSYVITVSSPTVTCQSITFSGNGTLRVNSGSILNVITSIIVDSSNSSNRTTAIQGAGTLNCSSVQVGTNSTPSGNFSTVLIATISNFNVSGNVGLVSRRAGSFSNNANFRLESGVLDIDGQITTTNQASGVVSTFTMASGAQTGVLLLSNANPFNLSTNTTNVIVLNGTSATVNYDGLSQNVFSTNYTNLTFSNSGTKTFLSSVSVASALSIATGGKAHLGTFTHTTRSINLGGTISTGQTWGSSASTATNKNDVFFESSTGLILIIREVNRIYTDYNGFFTSAGTTSVAANQPDTENNLLAFEWYGKIWATGVDNAVLTSNGVVFEDTKFRALKIFSIDATPGATYFLQGAAIDGSLSNRVLTPALIGSSSTPAELAQRLTDGKKGLSLGTGIANIKAGTSEFKIGTGNINISGVGDGKPDIIITQVAQPNAIADVFKFVDVNGNTIGNPITISFPSINAVGTYRLDLFNAADGSTANGFAPNETRDIRMLGYDFSDFGINASNEALVDRLVITFSGSSDCAFIGVNEGSLKRSELSLVKTVSITDCGKTGDTVTYTFEVKNTGDVPINKIKVNDFNPAVSIPSNTIALLAPGATATVTGTYVITAADVAIGKLENSAEVEGEDPSLSKVSDISGTNEFNNVPTVINLLDPPTIGTISNVTCSSVTSGSVVLNNLPATGNWSISSTPNVMGLSGTSGSGVTTIISGLPVGNYTFRVTSESGCISPSSINVSIVDASSTTWNGSSWSNGAPDATKNAIVTAVVPTSPFGSNLTACSLTISTGVTATVPSGVTLTITNAVTTNGQLIFENNASLVQTTNATNSGAIEYRRISSPMKNFDFTYWSSPVTGQTAKLLSPNTLADKYFRFDGLANDWIFDDGTMAPGVGFIIRVPKPGSPAPDNWSGSTYAQPVAFKGVPNNGNYSFGVGANQYNLVGNPYPSAIRADDFINANSGIIYGALYFWTHNTAIAPSGSDYVYTADDYASYTLAGGAGTSKAPSTGASGTVPNGFIAAGQSFFVGNAAAGSFQFTNAMRVSGNNSQFFKQASTKKAAAMEKNRVWLNLTNSGGAFKQLLVGYIEGATNDWDNLYDGPTFDGQEFVDFYSINQGQNLTIQGRALPFVDTDVVPLGYRSTIAGTFEISIDNRDGALTNQAIWLEDKKTNTLHELSKGKYTFTAINGVENDRFVLKYTNKTLGTDDNEVLDKSLIVSVKNKKITLTSSAESITQVQIFDLLGRKVYDKSKINAQEWSISTLPSSEQTLIVKTTLANGAISNKKIIY